MTYSILFVWDLYQLQILFQDYLTLNSINKRWRLTYYGLMGRLGSNNIDYLCNLMFAVYSKCYIFKTWFSFVDACAFHSRYGSLANWRSIIRLWFPT
jgi:hypothetical protein